MNVEDEELNDYEDEEDYCCDFWTEDTLIDYKERVRDFNAFTRSSICWF